VGKDARWPYVLGRSGVVVVTDVEDTRGVMVHRHKDRGGTMGIGEQRQTAVGQPSSERVRVAAGVSVGIGSENGGR
jgi:hypothetical protein